MRRMVENECEEAVRAEAKVEVCVEGKRKRWGRVREKKMERAGDARTGVPSVLRMFVLKEEGTWWVGERGRSESASACTCLRPNIPHSRFSTHETHQVLSAAMTRDMDDAHESGTI